MIACWAITTCREGGAALALGLLCADDLLERCLARQVEQLLDAGESPLRMSDLGRGTSWIVWFLTWPRSPAAPRGVIQELSMWT